MSSENIGGTALLGISKPVIKAHGSSNAKAIQNAIRQAVRDADSGVSERLHSNIGDMKISVDKTDEGS